LGHWPNPPIPKPQSPIPNPQKILKISKFILKKIYISINIKLKNKYYKKNYIYIYTYILPFPEKIILFYIINQFSHLTLIPAFHIPFFQIFSLGL